MGSGLEDIDHLLDDSDVDTEKLKGLTDFLTSKPSNNNTNPNTPPNNQQQQHNSHHIHQQQQTNNQQHHNINNQSHTTPPQPQYHHNSTPTTNHPTTSTALPPRPQNVVHPQQQQNNMMTSQTPHGPSSMMSKPSPQNVQTAGGMITKQAPNQPMYHSQQQPPNTHSMVGQQQQQPPHPQQSMQMKMSPNPMGTNQAGVVMKQSPLPMGAKPPVGVGGQPPQMGGQPNMAPRPIQMGIPGQPITSSTTIGPNVQMGGMNTYQGMRPGVPPGQGQPNPMYRPPPPGQPGQPGQQPQMYNQQQGQPIIKTQPGQQPPMMNTQPQPSSSYQQQQQIGQPGQMVQSSPQGGYQQQQQGQPIIKTQPGQQPTMMNTQPQQSSSLPPQQQYNPSSQQTQMSQPQQSSSLPTQQQQQPIQNIQMNQQTQNLSQQNPTPNQPIPSNTTQQQIQQQIQNHFNALALAYRNNILAKDVLMSNLMMLFGQENAEKYSSKIDNIDPTKVPKLPTDFNISSILEKTPHLREMTLSFQKQKQLQQQLPPPSSQPPNNQLQQPIPQHPSSLKPQAPLRQLPQTTLPNGAHTSTVPPPIQKEMKNISTTKKTEKKKKENDDKNIEDDKQSIKELNDVTRIANIDMRTESDHFLPDASGNDDEFYQPEVEPLFLNSLPLRKKINSIVTKNGIKTIDEGIFEYVSLATQDYVKTVIEYLMKSSQQRVDIHKEDLPYTITSDVKKKLLLIEKRERDERTKKENEENEKLLREAKIQEAASKKKGPDDKSAAALSKFSKARQEEEERVRTLAANSTALTALGNIVKKKPMLSRLPPLAPLQLTQLNNLIKEGNTLTVEQQTQHTQLTSQHELALKAFHEQQSKPPPPPILSPNNNGTSPMDTSSDSNSLALAIVPVTNTSSSTAMEVTPTELPLPQPTTTEDSGLLPRSGMGTFFPPSSLETTKSRHTNRRLSKKDCFFASNFIGTHVLQKYDLKRIKKLGHHTNLSLVYQ